MGALPLLFAVFWTSVLTWSLLAGRLATLRRARLRLEALSVKSRLKVLRTEKGWSQADLAERAGVSRQTINAVETERYEPSLSLAFKLARLFGRPIEEVFHSDGD